jgi:hypothetical protein
MIVVKIVLGLLAFVIFLIVFLRGLSKYVDYSAVRLARSYCREHGLEFQQVKIYSSYYGLYFRSNGKTYHAGYEVVKGKGVVWKKGTPLEIAGTKH